MDFLGIIGTIVALIFLLSFRLIYRWLLLVVAPHLGGILFEKLPRNVRLATALYGMLIIWIFAITFNEPRNWPYLVALLVGAVGIGFYCRRYFQQ